MSIQTTLKMTPRQQLYATLNLHMSCLLRDRVDHGNVSYLYSWRLQWRWILYSRGRVWAHHLSSAKATVQFSFLWWLTQFFIVCLCMQMSGRKKSHCRKGDWQWPPQLIIVPELKLKWWTKTVHRLNKKHQWRRLQWKTGHLSGRF